MSVFSDIDLNVQEILKEGNEKAAEEYLRGLKLSNPSEQVKAVKERLKLQRRKPRAKRPDTAKEQR